MKVCISMLWAGLQSFGVLWNTTLALEPPCLCWLYGRILAAVRYALGFTAVFLLSYLKVKLRHATRKKPEGFGRVASNSKIYKYSIGKISKNIIILVFHHHVCRYKIPKYIILMLKPNLFCCNTFSILSSIV